MQIEKYHWKTEEAFHRIKTGQPVVLQECPVICPTYTNWTFDSIAEMVKEDFPCDVFVSKSRRFPYFDSSKNTYKYQFEPTTKKVNISFKEFLAKPHEVVDEDDESGGCTEFYYLHQSLVAEMGNKVLEEYAKFSLQTAALYKVLAGWNELTHNLLLCGREGFITPLHFDEQENLFTQLQGRKRVRLFSPDYWHALYPFPNGHPQDRQAQVALSETPGGPDSEESHRRFPAFRDASINELYVDLEPGEILYIPQYWFHQMEGLSDNISVSWWFKHNLKKDIDYKNINLNEISLTAVRRNIEGVMAHMVGYGKKAHDLFLSIASGLTKIKGMHYKTAPSSSSSLTNIRSRAVTVGGPIYCTTDLLIVDTDAGALKLGHSAHSEDEQLTAVVDQAISMLETIFKENASGFLLQVVAGRFNAFY